MSELPETTILFPDYQDETNYNAIIDLCPEDERPVFKPFEEARALTLNAAESGRKENQDSNFVVVTAEKWRDWCKEQGRPCKHAEIFPYVTWLRLSALSGGGMGQPESDTSDILPNDE